jgi:rhodanese-related sulfurtransferase
MTELKRVSPVEAKRLIDEEGYTYLDVRTEAEFVAGRPTGAKLVPMMLAGPSGMAPNPDFLKGVESLFPKDAKLVVGCKAGGRSARAAAVLGAAGYTNVIDQRAGFDGARDAFGQVTEKGWVESGLPVEKGPVEKG